MEAKQIKGLTEREREVLAVVKANMRYLPPTMARIGELCKCTRARAHQVVSELRRKGYLTDSDTSGYGDI